MHRLTWLGGATTHLELGSFRILTDPMFCEGPQAFFMDGHPSTGEDNVPIARLTPLPVVTVDRLDLLMVSHLHSDHFDACAVERLDKRLEVIAPTPNLTQLQQWGFQQLNGLDWNEERAWGRGDEHLRVIAVPAHHSHDPGVSHDLGVVNGYLLEHVGQTGVARVYWTGDTVWFEEMHRVVERFPIIDLLLPHLGAVGKDGPWGLMSLDGVEGARVVMVARPRTVIPIHHSTFSQYVEPVSRFVQEVRATGLTGELVVLGEGETWVFATPRAT